MTVGCKTPPTDSPGNSPEWIQHRWYKESVSQSVDMDCCHLWMHTMMIPLRTSVAHSLLVCWHSVQKKPLTDCREGASSLLLVHMMLKKGIKHWNYWLPRINLYQLNQLKHHVQTNVKTYSIAPAYKNLRFPYSLLLKRWTVKTMKSFRVK